MDRPRVDGESFQIMLDKDWFNPRDILVIPNRKFHTYRSRSEIQKSKNLNFVSRLSRTFKVYSVWKLENKLTNYITK